MVYVLLNTYLWHIMAWHSGSIMELLGLRTVATKTWRSTSTKARKASKVWSSCSTSAAILAMAMAHHGTMWHHGRHVAPWHHAMVIVVLVVIEDRKTTKKHRFFQENLDKRYLK